MTLLSDGTLVFAYRWPAAAAFIDTEGQIHMFSPYTVALLHTDSDEVHHLPPCCAALSVRGAAPEAAVSSGMRT